MKSFCKYNNLENEKNIIINIKSNYTKKQARPLIWDYYQNNDIPTTFAKKKQEIEDIDQFQQETFELFFYLMNKNNNFESLANLNENESLELIQYMSPGKDKPINMIYWNKCLLATICCGSAPTEQQFNNPSYNGIIDSLVNNKIIPLLYLVINEINKYGEFKIVKTIKENNQICKTGRVFYIHSLSIIRAQVAPQMAPLAPNELKLCEQRLEIINNEYKILNSRLDNLNNEYNKINDLINVILNK
jgi:hypothetical protein